ncbi:MAG: metalloregulator ArsR/SmtB family transcription factor [Oscillatoria sp. PMC 1051.18]|nr:metalloregulator ArsR/SmtB family transcription factor [Oscillatoria sp. PMC 1050.18]MEC5028518.1 metalloregulator ArsR/SmtB family transcription factor [Oscillatoria sp. PMC 1051.18]
MTSNHTVTASLLLAVQEPEESELRAKIFAALADPTRLKIVELLAQNEELSGSEIAQSLDISLALFCHHSKILLEAGLVETRKEGQTKYNSLNWELLSACFSSLQKLRQTN